MLTFKVLAALLVYPEPELIESLDEMAVVLDAERALPKAERREVEALMSDLRRADLMDAQARYVALFDQSRSLSLHLYEHSHGELRDRGQAMVNLLNHYRSKGLEPGTTELPDFLPVLLEFLSMQPADEVRALLDQATPVVALLRARLERRGSSYAAVFRAIEALAGHRADEAAIRETVMAETPDDTPEALDRAWAEAPVTFGNDPSTTASSGCGAASAMVARFAPRSGHRTTADGSCPR